MGWVGSGRVNGVNQFTGGLSWIGLMKTDPWTTPLPGINSLLAGCTKQTLD